MASPRHYIIAARRTALGRPGGLHKARRIADLAAPVITAVLADAGLKPEAVDEAICGSVLEGGNPARLIALTAGLPDRTSAYTIDRGGASGLDAILAAVRTVELGAADVVVAGGADSVSTAPWRVAKPKALTQLPCFLGAEGAEGDGDDAGRDGLEALAKARGISRMRQDAYVVEAHLRAEAAREAKRFLKEIVPLRANAEETRDQSAVEPSLADLERLAPFHPPHGTLTPGNTSVPHDGAAFAAIVSAEVWERLGRPAALSVSHAAAVGSRADAQGEAVASAVLKVLKQAGDVTAHDLGGLELSESSAAELLALADTLGLEPRRINADGGAVVRGHPAGAAGAVAFVRLFTNLIKSPRDAGAALGIAAAQAAGGLGVALLCRRSR